jgi:leucyl aminopeptidase (aminopeptidase T)
MGAERIVGHCAGLRAGERALVLCDPGTRAVGAALAAAARAITAAEDVEVLEIPPLRMHGDEPPAAAADAMLAADVVFGATAFSLAHARARVAATAAGARYLSLPDLTPERLGSAALDADFRALTPLADAYAARFTAGAALTITSRAGTHLRCAIGGRAGNAAPGWTDAPGGLASPPDAEANVAPLEDGSDGVIVVDGSIPHPDFGLLDHAVELVVRAGRVVDVAGPGAAGLRALLGAAPENAVVAEIGVGLNPRAALSGAMLEDEGCAGTVHVGIGGNAGLGGANAASFHLDHVLRAPTLEVDGERLIDAGTLALCPQPPSP